ncbi:MAG: DAK2 domain-containing protein [Vallitaleaceae bacterium]|nr:DAK2 domain-containing protein [Vallitaleaceae bacterium]
MAIETIQSNIVRNMFIAGAKYLESKKKYVDELNVFPVPDGDTGTNMTLTIMAAAKEVEKADGSDMAAVAKAISSGSLRGARGNSGVILSQILRGIAKEISSVQDIDTVILAQALVKGSETAYKAVMKPKEGTMLTVIRGAAEKASEIALQTTDIIYALKEIIRYASEVLDRTPEMLPVLKEAGVVDAGGQGLIYILKGALYALESGKDVVLNFENHDEDQEEVTVTMIHHQEDIKFGYCTEFIIDTGDRNSLEENEEHAKNLQRYLETIGDSIVAVADEDLIKIHVHTNDPGLAMQKGLTIGQLMNMKIDNMRIQHAERVIHNVDTYLKAENKPVELKDFGFIAVSVGEGMNQVFESLGVDYIVTGGQTMNPSTEDFVNAVAKVAAKNIYLLPNNKNIILAANQVSDLVEDKNIFVIPTKTLPQGISSLIVFDASLSAQENFDNMTEASTTVKTGQLTYAVRDTSIDQKIIKEGDILGINDEGIVAVSPDVHQSAIELCKKMIDGDSEIVTIYYGEEVSEEDADALASYLEEEYEEIEVEVHFGGQPLYYYFISVE